MKLQSPKRILVCEFHQETNTFNPITHTLKEFQAVRHLEGQSFYDTSKGISGASHGAMDAIEEVGGRVLPTISLYATSGGRVDDSVLELAKKRVKYYAENYGEFDAVYAALHGATCTVRLDDACGDFLEFLREVAGDRPVVASCDLHANVTEKMLRNADAICGFQTYPHVDIYETGYRAGKMCMRLLAGEPVFMAATYVPLLVPPVGYTSLEGEFKKVIDSGKAMVADGTLLDFTTFQVQPWMDIESINSTVIAIADNPDAAKKQADILAKKLFDGRDDYWPDLMSIDDAIDRAEQNTSGKPVLLVDSADSTNGGAVGDSVAVALRLLERGSKLTAAMFVKDPEVVRQAFSVGVGNSAEFRVGAKFTPNMPGPLKAIGTVRSLHDGYFFSEGSSGRGGCYHVGMAAVISFGNIDILVCEAPKASGNPQLLRHFGIEPTMYNLVVVKANTSFLASYGKFAGEICYVDTPGAGASNWKHFQWQNLPKGLYPFDLPDDYQPKASKIWS